MEEYIAFDSHKHYNWVEHERVQTGKTRQYRLEHAPGSICRALAKCPPGTPVALEATANWYGIVDEIEQAGLVPRLVHPRQAKLLMGLINKTDKLDAHGLNPSVDGHAAHGLDSARGAAGADPSADGLEEPPLRHPGQVRSAGQPVERPLW